MIRSIIVPLDGSPFSEQALPVAAAIARESGARLRLVRVHQRDLLLGFVPGAPSAEAQRIAEREHLERLANELAVTGLTTEVELLEGDVLDALTAYVETTQADLVVAATHGRSNLVQTFLGSVAQSLMRRLKVPTLLVRVQPEGPDSARPLPLRRLLVALDGSAAAEAMLARAVELGRAMKSHFTLLRVVNPVIFFEPGESEFTRPCRDVETTRREVYLAKKYLERVAEPLQAKGLNVEVKVVVHSDAAAAILDAAHECGADLIALESHGKSGLDRLILGSVTDSVVQNSASPVMARLTDKCCDD